MKIIVDMMGGDNAPLAVLEGAAQAVKEYGVQLIGVGNEALVRKTAAEHNIPLDGIELVNCTEVIDMCDEPARAIPPEEGFLHRGGSEYAQGGQRRCLCLCRQHRCAARWRKPHRAHPAGRQAPGTGYHGARKAAGLSAAGLRCQCGVPPGDAGRLCGHG